MVIYLYVTQKERLQEEEVKKLSGLILGSCPSFYNKDQNNTCQYKRCRY